MKQMTRWGRTLEADERRKKKWLEKQAAGSRIQAHVEKDLSELINEAHKKLDISKEAFIREACLDLLEYHGYDISKWA